MNHGADNLCRGKVCGFSLDTASCDRCDESSLTPSLLCKSRVKSGYQLYQTYQRKHQKGFRRIQLVHSATVRSSSGICAVLLTVCGSCGKQWLAGPSDLCQQRAKSCSRLERGCPVGTSIGSNFSTYFRMSACILSSTQASISDQGNQHRRGCSDHANTSRQTRS